MVMTQAFALVAVLLNYASADTTNLTSYDLPGNAVCLNGCPASVQAAVRDEKLWVITLGGISPNLNWCLSPQNCLYFSSAPAGGCGSSTGKTAPLNNGGLQNPDCSENPTFCGASQAMIESCDFALYLGDQVTSFNGTSFHFRGQSVLAEAIKKLAALGMSQATHVLLTGQTWAGTAALLQADKIGQLLKASVPGLQSYKVMPVDGMHPDFPSMFCASGLMKDNCNTTAAPSTYLPQALESLYNLTNAQAYLPDSCNGVECLWMANLIKHIKTPIFIVQQMPGTWDLQCNYEGTPAGNILQVSCSVGGNYFRGEHACTQYPDLCTSDQVYTYVAPLQRRYLSDVGTTPGFMHTCFLGVYMNSAKYNNAVLKMNTGWWNQIRINGKTMRESISEWWTNGSQTQYQDATWDGSRQPPSPPGSFNIDVGTPVVPWYTNRYMTNPTCRGDPWYLTSEIQV